MKTKVNQISMTRWLFVIIFNVFIIWRDLITYEKLLDNQQGNFFEFIIFSLNNIYFIVLFGVVSVWILVADYKEITGIDFLAMIRFPERSRYYKARMKHQRNRVFNYVFIVFALRFVAAKTMHYPIGTIWNILNEYQEFSSVSIIYLVIKLFLGILGYLCFFTWLRETIGEMATSGFLRNILPGIFPIIELAIFKSMNWKYLGYLPIGNILLDYQNYNKEIFGIVVYWLFILEILYFIRCDLYIRKDYYE